MIFFRGANDNVHDVRKTAAATTTLFHSVIDFCRNNQLPTVIVQKGVDDVSDFAVSDKIATANEHAISAIKHDIRYPLFIKRIAYVKKKMVMYPEKAANRGF